MKFLICKLFGHKMDYPCMEHHNMQVCLRCGDSRGYYDGTEFWTNLEYYGLLFYPLYKIKTYFRAEWTCFKIRIGKLKIKNKYNDEDDCPF